MNHLVALDTQTGELEKILSGVKTMLVKECDPGHPPGHSVNPGDSLYFLKDKHDCALRVKATVVRVLPVTSNSDEGLSQTLKEMQSKLQLSEDQFNFWSVKHQVLLVEFDSTHKIDAIHLGPKATHGSDWLAFKEFSIITE